MEDSYMRFFAERIYRELVALECIPGFLTSKHALRGLFKIALEDYESLEELCTINSNLRGILDSAKNEITHLIETYGHYVKGKRIGIIDRLEIAIL